MKILLVYPQHTETFWSFKHALKFVSKRAAHPPLGLLTVAAMLPASWEKKLVDLNVQPLTDEDISWADYAFVSAMSIQRESSVEVIRRCGSLGTKVVAGGPLFTTGYDDFSGVDHFVLGEAESLMPSFVKDLEAGQAKHMYSSEEWPDLSQTPVPAWNLLNMKYYSSMSIQYSRGCPYDCEFCDIVVLNGRKPRTKSTSQLVAELDALYERGWRHAVFMVDDNFIGNKNKLKAEILPAVIEWMRKRRYPFKMFTQVSINLADDEELMDLMTQAGFDTVFIGIETPDEDCLQECGKHNNTGRDLVESVHLLQHHGFQVQAGFIIGFDHDTPSIFERQVNFIQKSGIVAAMVSLLNAPRGTRLYKRLMSEHRLLSDIEGGNATINFIPRMSYETLAGGYRKVLTTIYSPKEYYERIGTLLKEYRPRQLGYTRPHFHEVVSAVRVLWALGIQEGGRRHYWKSFMATLLRRPSKLPMLIRLAAYGCHFRKVAEEYSRSMTDTLSAPVQHSVAQPGQ